jgi:hypothetical protein
MGDLDELAAALNRKPTKSAPRPVGTGERPSSIDYATPVPAQSTNAPRHYGAGLIARYRRRVGHRSFIFQIWLGVWTIFYLVWIISLTAFGASHTPPAPPFPGMMPAPPTSNFADVAALFTSSWMLFCMGWGIAGLPIGIAAVATMDNNH